MSTPSPSADRAGTAGAGEDPDGSADGASATSSQTPGETSSETCSEAGSRNEDAAERPGWTLWPRRRARETAETAESASTAGPRAKGRAKKRPKKKGSLLKELPVLLIIAFGLAVVIKTFLFQAFFIPSGSMEPTLHGCPGCAGDRVLVNKIVYYFGDPQPGDVVVFEGPETWAPEVQIPEPANWFASVMGTLGRAIGVGPPSEKDYVKRVVAVAGQTVQCCDAEGRVMVDGEPVDEPYIVTNNPLESRSFAPVTVPEGRLWVMGDNRAGSADSRYHVDDQYSGTIAMDDVIGKAALIVWPFSRFTVLDDPDIQGLAATVSSGPSGLSGPAAGGAPLALGVGFVLPFATRRRRCGLRGRHPPP